MKKILIIANARYKGGLSGSDNIHINFAKYWSGKVTVKNLLWLDFKPFWLCYGLRIVVGILIALVDFTRTDLVYSASDFLADSIPAYIYKLKGAKWVAGFYLFAPREKKIYWHTQQFVKKLIKKHADIICITNGSMKYEFLCKPTIEVNGGVDLEFCIDYAHKEYEAVFCGRIHETKGIKELIKIWDIVTDDLPGAKLALIGDGDLGLNYVRNEMARYKYMDITLLGFMDKSRFKVYGESKLVLYTSTDNHFSMAPVEAMSCGCPMIAFDLLVMDTVKPHGTLLAKDCNKFAEYIKTLLTDDKAHTLLRKEAKDWADKWSWPEVATRVYKEIEHELYGL